MDGKEEPPWMTREAEFFAACIQMPRDRYLPVAERRIAEVVNSQPSNSGYLRTLDEKLRLASHYIDSAQSAGWPPDECNLLMPRVFDTAVVEDALELLDLDHGAQVSKAAQRRRFAEMGLAFDAAEVFSERPGFPKLQRFSQFFLSDVMGSKLNEK